MVPRPVGHRLKVLVRVEVVPPTHIQISTKNNKKIIYIMEKKMIDNNKEK